MGAFQKIVNSAQGMDGLLYMCKVQFRQDLLYPARTNRGCGTNELMIFTAKMGSCVSIV